MAPAATWLDPPAVLPLDGAWVHVWQVDLERAERDQAWLIELLSADERRRADAYSFERDRRTFVIGRGVLRQLIGRYLDRAPDRIVFHAGPHGKPQVAGLQFNLSHSADRALLAFSRDRDVGVDLEALRPVADYERLARATFSPAESATLMRLPPDRRLESFLACWTRKEALLKASGLGLTGSPAACEVSVSADEPARLVAMPEAWSWSLEDLPPMPGYVSALAVAGRGHRRAQFRWSGGS